MAGQTASEAITSRPQAWAAGLPNQAMTLSETLAAYTCDPAWVEFQEAVKGRLAPGMLADMVLLDADIFALPAAELAQVRPYLTLCDGRIVHAR